MICSITVFKPGISFRSGFNIFSIKTASRSKISTSLSVTSPWTHNGKPTFAIYSKTCVIFSKFFTPDEEFVVAPAGYNLIAVIIPVSTPSFTSLMFVSSVKYRVIKGLNSEPFGNKCNI